RKDSRRYTAQIYADRHPTQSLQRPLQGMDRNLLDTDEGDIRGRNDKPTDQRQGQNRPRTADQDGTFPAINVQPSITLAPQRASVGSWPQAAVEGCLLFRRCQGISTHPANRPKMTRVTHSGQQVGACRFRFQSGTGGVREIKALREMSPAAFSVSIETGST